VLFCSVHFVHNIEIRHVAEAVGFLFSAFIRSKVKFNTAIYGQKERFLYCGPDYLRIYLIVFLSEGMALPKV